MDIRSPTPQQSCQNCARHAFPEDNSAVQAPKSTIIYGIGEAPLLDAPLREAGNCPSTD
jgi:hypothetical protein